MTVYSMLAKTTKTHPGISVLESQLQSFSNMLRIFPWKELSSEDGIVLDDLLRHIYDIEQSYSLINSLLEKVAVYFIFPLSVLFTILASQRKCFD